MHPQLDCLRTSVTLFTKFNTQGTLLSQTNCLTRGRQLSLSAQRKQYPDYSLSASGHSVATCNNDPSLCTCVASCHQVRSYNAVKSCHLVLRQNVAYSTMLCYPWRSKTTFKLAYLSCGPTDQSCAKPNLQRPTYTATAQQYGNIYTSTECMCDGGPFTHSLYTQQ